MSGQRLETTEERSALMRRVRQRDTAPERAVRQLLWATGARYRTNVTDLPGSPDIANQSRKKAVFVHGCYWHHHGGCDHATVPKRNREFWVQKFRRNQERDRRKERALREMDFDVLVVWACELDAPEGLQRRLESFWYDRPS